MVIVSLVRFFRLCYLCFALFDSSGLFNEVMKIPRLTKVEAMTAAKKLVSDESGLTIFYECPDDEWKKDFILNLIHPDLPPFN